jgi:putative spermidine/putrescine transport system permease protein
MSLFLVGAGRTTLPIVISSTSSGRSIPTIAAVSVVQILLIAAAMLITDRYVKLAPGRLTWRRLDIDNLASATATSTP